MVPSTFVSPPPLKNSVFIGLAMFCCSSYVLLLYYSAVEAMAMCLCPSDGFWPKSQFYQSGLLFDWIVHRLCELTGKSLMHVCDRYWRKKTEHRMPTNFCWACKMLLPGGRGTNRIQKSYVLSLRRLFTVQYVLCSVLPVCPFLRPSHPSTTMQWLGQWHNAWSRDRASLA